MFFSDSKETFAPWDKGCLLSFFLIALCIPIIGFHLSMFFFAIINLTVHVGNIIVRDYWLFGCSMSSDYFSNGSKLLLEEF